VALKNVIGIDHAVVMVKDLDKAAENYKGLGFTVSPRGTHSAHMGSGNYTIMFDPDYMELLGVLTPTEHNAPARAFLDKRGEGIERIAFTGGGFGRRSPRRDPRTRLHAGRPRPISNARWTLPNGTIFGGEIPHLPVADRGSARWASASSPASTRRVRRCGSLN